MTDFENEHFTPEKIDEQIDSTLNGHYSTQQYLDPLDRHIVENLQRYFAPSGDQQQPLERTWKRLAQQRNALRSPQNTEVHSNGVPLDSSVQFIENNPMKKTPGKSSSINKPSRRLSLIAAIILVLLVVGVSFAMFYSYQITSGRISNGPGSVTPSLPPPHSDSLYFVVNNALYRYNTSTHKQVWSFPMPLPSNAENIGSHAEVINGVVYTLGTGSDGYYSYAINASDGSLRWKYKVIYQTADLSLLGQQLIANGIIYLSEASARQGYTIVTALDAPTGAVLWQQRYDGTGISTRDNFVDPAAGLTLEAASSDVLYGTTFTGKNITTLFAINTKNGTALWRKEISTDGEQPDYVGGLIVNNVLCISASQTDQPGSRHLYGIDATTGVVIWNVPLDGVTYGLTVSNGTIYLGTIHYQTVVSNGAYNVIAASGTLYAVQATDGNLLWHYTAQGGVSFPVVQNGIVAASISREDTSNQQTIIAFDTVSGKQLWTRTTSFEIGFNEQLVASINFIYLGTTGGQVQVLRLTDGKLMDTLSLPPPGESVSAVIVMTVVSE